MEYRHFYLAAELVRQGHHVCVIASGYSHLRFSQPLVGSSKLTPEVIGGISYYWLAGGKYTGNGIGRLRNMMSFSVDVLRLASKLATSIRPDAVIVSSPHPFAAYGGRSIASHADACFVFEVRDLWPGSLIELVGVPAWHPLAKLIDAAEGYGCRHADLVVSLLPHVEGYMRRRGVSADRLAIIGNGYCESDLEVNPSLLDGLYRNAIQSSRSRGHFLVGYAGSHGIPNALEFLIDAAALLRDDRIDFLLIGDGQEKAVLAQRIAKLKLDNILLLPAMPKAHLPSLFAELDAGYIGWRDRPIYRHGVSPNKLFDYLGSGLPVVHSINSSADLVAVSGAGYVVPAEDPPAIAAAFRALRDMDRRKRLQLGSNGRDYIRQRHSYRMLAAQYADRLRQVVESRRIARPA